MGQFVKLIGMVADVRKRKFTKKMLYVGVSNDELGKSISISDNSTGIMYQIPFEPIEKFLKEGNE